MKKALGFRLMDSIKEVMRLENAKTELTTALYLRKADEKIKNGLETIEENLKAQASVYGVKFENYIDRVSSIKNNYLKEINKLREEYEFQFVNLQLELREIQANQQISLVNAKKILDTKNEFIKSDKYKSYINTKENLIKNLNNALKKSDYDKYYKMIEDLADPIELYNQKKKIALKKYSDYESIIKDCEAKIEYCMNETFSEIDRITNENIENKLLIKKENPVTKIINKVLNIISGKSKFEGKIKIIENNLQNLSLSNDAKVETIRNNTIEMVADIQEEKDSLNEKAA